VNYPYLFEGRYDLRSAAAKKYNFQCRLRYLQCRFRKNLVKLNRIGLEASWPAGVRWGNPIPTVTCNFRFCCPEDNWLDPNPRFDDLIRAYEENR
jgi:hypothetical protein